MQPPASYQALVREGHTLRIEQAPTPISRSAGLLVALEYVGICGTDLQILNGTRPDTAAVLGHEGVGTVALAGEGAHMRPGDRVVFNPVAQLSAGRLLGHNVDGLFQQYIAVDAQAVESGLVLPAEGLSPPICGALVEPLGAVIYAQELISRAVPRLKSAAVFGAGPVGLLATQLLSALGVKVFLIHPRPVRLNTAVELKLIHPDETLTVSESLPEQLLARNDGNRLDACLICTTRQGAPLALRHALAVVAGGGCIDLITNYPENGTVPEGLDTESLRAVRAANVCGSPQEGAYLHIEAQGHIEGQGRRIAITGHRGTSADHLEKAMRELRSRPASYAKLITHVLSLRSAADAIPTLAHSAQRTLNGRDCIKAVIDLTTDGEPECAVASACVSK
jgi:2-epi-valiolone-7-phosphate 1-reductase